MSCSLQPIATGRLTRKFLMGLSEGVYLVSNISRTRGKSVFEGYVISAEMRHIQWDDIKKAGADGRLCDIFRSRAHYEEFRKAFPRQLLRCDVRIAILEALLNEGHHGDN
jgi:hypothetical protein